MGQMVEQDAVKGIIRDLLDRAFAGKRTVTVLEAGCGSASRIELQPNYRVTGIDISPEQLARNTYAAEKIEGDIESYDFGDRTFDLIICWDVVEHLANPEQAIGRFVRHLGDGGMIVIAAPNVLSVKGLITKLTPHWFHVWVSRTIFKRADAGRPGCPPFPTYLRLSIAPNALKSFAEANGLEVVELSYYRTILVSRFQQRRGLPTKAYKALLYAAKKLSLNRFDGDLADFFIVLRKPAAPAEMVEAIETAEPLEAMPQRRAARYATG